MAPKDQAPYAGAAATAECSMRACAGVPRDNPVALQEEKVLSPASVMASCC